MPNDDVNILYIAGWSRSGSTILGNIIGEVDRMVHVGEMYYLWERGVHENRTCGCGKAFTDCSWWKPILNAYRSDRAYAPIDWMRKQHEKFARTRYFPKLWINRSRIEADHEFQTYTQGLLSLYRSIQKTTNAEFIVDSSKSPTYALILSSIPGLKVSIIHLIRDPRGTAYSWRKRLLHSKEAYTMGRLSIFRNGAMWLIWNLLIEAMQKRRVANSYTRIRYEDFASQPRLTVEQILNDLKIDDRLDFFQDPSQVNLGLHHTVAGNPARSRTGRIRIRPDREWIEKFGRFEKLFTTVLTMPLLLRYGYPITAAPDSIHLQLYP